MIVVRDPNVSYGRFRALQTTRGDYFVYDPERPLGKRTVSTHGTLKEADAACRRLAEAANKDTP